MNPTVPVIYLVRHGGTEWSVTGQHTGRTDISLSPDGEREASLLRTRFKTVSFDQVFTSPLQRATRTCVLAGFGDIATVDDDLVEWNYGHYEGRTSTQIRQRQPDWDLFRDGCPSGESIADISTRADRVVKRLLALNGTVILFSHGHFLRVLAARWLRLDANEGRCFFLETTAVSIMGYEHGHSDPVIRLWNDCHHKEN